LDEAIADLNDRLGGLPSPTEAEDIWDDLWHEEAHHSTALEGNTLVLKQVRQLLDEGRAVGSKELSEYMEVQGYANAARWVYGQALEPGAWNNGELLTLHEVRAVHQTAMTPA
jgi:Fic family protein